MTLCLFILALAALLLTPGPTNTLLAIGGSKASLGEAARLAAGELAGYLTSTIPLVLFLAPWLAANPVIADGVKLCAAFWVLFLAVRMFRQSGASTGGITRPVTPGLVYLTTLFNPKGLIIGLALIPGGSAAEALPYLAAMAVVIVAASAFWLAVGASLVRRVSQRHPALVARAAGVALVFFAATLAGKVAGLV